MLSALSRRVVLVVAVVVAVVVSLAVGCRSSSQEPAAEGQPCANDEACGEGLRCDLGTCRRPASARRSDGAVLLEHYRALQAIVVDADGACDALRAGFESYAVEHGGAIERIWAKAEKMTGSKEEGEALGLLVIEVAGAAAECEVELPGGAPQ